MSIRRLFSHVFLTALIFSGLQAAAPEPVSYTLRFPEALHHYVEVEADLPAEGRDELEIFMPVWTPGSYLVREYARNIDRIDASAGGAPLTITKTAKNRWTIATAGHDRVQVTYRVYGWEASVRTNFIERDFAILNGAPTFLTVVGNHQRPHQVRVELPADWQGAYSPLPQTGEPGTFVAPDFDTLIDSPILAGSPQVNSFELDGAPHFVVTVGGEGIWDNARAARHFEQIARTQAEFWGGLPTKEPFYIFNLLIGGRGGLEHKQSFVMMADRWLSRSRGGMISWLSLVSHEYFHLWNGKRLRPVELGPFPYEHEAYTRSLWVVEGITSYYQHLLLRRAGYYTRQDFLNNISSSIAGLERTPGRFIQSLSESSFDAWIKGYRPDENAPNTRISYYGAGAVAALLLDAEIRRVSNGERSLDDLMRAAYARYSGEVGYTEAEFVALASEIAGSDLAPWFERNVANPGQFDYEPMLAWYGLKFEAPKKPDQAMLPNALEPPDAPAGWIGVGLRGNVVSEVRSDTPAYAAGLYVDDEIIAVEGFRVSNGLDSLLRYYHPGDTVELLVSRRGALRTLSVTLGIKPEQTWKLVPAADATSDQKTRLKEWLGEDESQTDNKESVDNAETATSDP